MTTTRAKTGLTSLGSVGSGWWLVVGIAIAALLVGLMSTMIRGGESTDLTREDSFTMVKLSQVETLGRVALTERPEIGYTEFKLDQVADLGFGDVATASSPDVHARFKLDQVRGEQVTVVVPPNLVE